MEAYKTFVEERIIGRRNLWDNMTKVKQKTWMSTGKYIQLYTGTEMLPLKATTSLFARLLVIARSFREGVSGRSEEVIAMHECETMTGVSTQEEADALMIHHAVEVASNGMNIHIYPQNTDVLFLALRRTPLIGDRSAAIKGTTEKTTQRLHTSYI